ncbi:MAG: hypothetical protein NC084_02720 [Bacteroides sp.]|nr:hypothetical protein [Bacteroides sp.]
MENFYFSFYLGAGVLTGSDAFLLRGSVLFLFRERFNPLKDLTLPKIVQAPKVL